ncbi:FAD-dependent oxidoreductase [Sphingomonas changnyeongensis]|uniref:FAD-dependent oxidoreductase n=1 Tax=Sphingomonas changnyeongensis TaxID=2698679 RepID=A0A7Z2NXK2_9SPHN|nr:FAD-dependent oxidoreductase [Sphingomonas changnyeongensis]
MAADGLITVGGGAGADDVIVIGGGIAGCATACYLARDGVRVRLVEQAAVNGLASSANAGSLHAQIPHDPFRHLGADWARRFSPAVRLFIASLGIWKTLETDLGPIWKSALAAGCWSVPMRPKWRRSKRRRRSSGRLACRSSCSTNAPCGRARPIWRKRSSAVPFAPSKARPTRCSLPPPMPRPPAPPVR